MANYYGVWRTNYFKVKDAEAFKTWAKSIGSCVDYEVNPDGTGAYIAQSKLADGTGIPCMKETEGRDVEDFDIYTELGALLEKGSVAIFMEVGNEKLRYLVGQAIAVDHEGDVIEVGLSDIYARVQEEWGVDFSVCEH